MNGLKSNLKSTSSLSIRANSPNSPNSTISTISINSNSSSSNASANVSAISPNISNRRHRRHHHSNHNHKYNPNRSSDRISFETSLSKPKSSSYNTPTIQRLRERRSKLINNDNSKDTSASSSSHLHQHRHHRQHLNGSIQSQVHFQSILRIRPFVQKENEAKEKSIFSISDNATKLCMHKHRPASATAAGRTRGLGLGFHQQQQQVKAEFQFDSILEENASQEEVYDAIQASQMIESVMTCNTRTFRSSGESEAQERQVVPAGVTTNHVILSMGVSNSGKTYTMFGKNTATQDQETHMGIVPRLLQDLFFVGKYAYGKRQDQHQQQHPPHSEDGIVGTEDGIPIFALEISMVHVYNDRVYDMLCHKKGDDSKKRKPKKAARKRSHVLQMAESLEQQQHQQPSIPVRKLRYLAAHHTKPVQQQHHQPQLQELRIHQDPQTQDFHVDPTIVSCRTLEEANDSLKLGLKENIISSTSMNSSSSRGHTIVSLQPTFLRKTTDVQHDDDHPATTNRTTGDYENEEHKSSSRILKGGLITIIDMAGIERTKSSAVVGSAMKESAAINSTISSVLQCLRCIKQNHHASAAQQKRSHSAESTNTTTNNKSSTSTTRLKTQIIPYRQNKLTMMMQPLFSGNIQHDQSRKVCSSNNIVTNVQILVSTYPGMKDYNEKKSLFGQVDAMRGLSVSSKKKRCMKEEIKLVIDSANGEGSDDEDDQNEELEKDLDSEFSVKHSVELSVKRQEDTSPSASDISNTSCYGILKQIENNRNIHKVQSSPVKASPLKRLAAKMKSTKRAKRKRAI